MDFPLYFALPVILSPFVAWAILVHQAGPTQGKSLMSLVSTHRTFLLVIWEGKTYYLDYTVKDLEESTVEDVCARCSQVTGVPAWSIEFSVGPKGPSLSRDGHEGVVPGGQLIMTGELIKVGVFGITEGSVSPYCVFFLFLFPHPTLSLPSPPIVQ